MRLIRLFTIIAMLLLSIVADAKGLNVKTFRPSGSSIFQNRSVILYGKKDAYLVDAQFEKQNAEELVGVIKKLGKNLKLVFVSYSDPDYYFGLDAIHKAFPDAKIVSTAQTAYLISASKDDKLNVWKDQLGDNAPSELIVPEAIDSIPSLEGNKIEIRYRKGDSAHDYLWIPSLGAVVGGNSFEEGAHPWMADTQTPEAIDQWLAVLDDMMSLQPKVIYFAHGDKEQGNPKEIYDFLKGYLTTYKQAAARATDANSLIAAMKTAYPSLPGDDDLMMGAKVLKHEQKWAKKNAYQPIGRSIVVNFGSFSFRNTFSDNKHMHFEGLDGDYKGQTDDVEYTAVEVSPNVFMVYWSEPKSKANVVHLQNYNDMTVWTNISYPNGKFYHLAGTIKLE